jgi:predicted nucleic acid-binding protein
MKDELVLVDTNILVYSYDASEPEKQKVCCSLIKKCWMREVSYAVALQNLSEFYVIVTQKIEKPLSAEIAKKIVKDIIDFSNWQVVGFNDAAVITAIDLCMKYDVHYWDALLCATMKQSGITSIYTVNVKDFEKVPWITAVNPLK